MYPCDVCVCKGVLSDRDDFRHCEVRLGDRLDVSGVNSYNVGRCPKRRC